MDNNGTAVTKEQQAQGLNAKYDEWKKSKSGEGKLEAPEAFVSGTGNNYLNTTNTGLNSRSNQDSAVYSEGKNRAVSTTTSVWKQPEEKEVENYKNFINNIYGADGDGEGGMSVAAAYKKAYQPPTEEALKKAKDAAKKRKFAANLSESLRLISDMGNAFAGGNVYKREGVERHIKEADKLEKDAEEKYENALNEYKKGLYGAEAEDLAQKRKLFDDYIAKQWGVKTEQDSTSESLSKQHSVTNSEQKQSNIIQNPQAHIKAQGEILNGGKNSDNITPMMYVKITKNGVDKDGNPVKNEEFQYAKCQPVSKAHFDSVKPVVLASLAEDKDAIAYICNKEGLKEEVVKSILSGKSVTVDEYGSGYKTTYDPDSFVLKYWGYNKKTASAMYPGGIPEGYTQDGYVYLNGQPYNSRTEGQTEANSNAAENTKVGEYANSADREAAAE